MLMGQGLTDAEIARAMRLDDSDVRAIGDRITAFLRTRDNRLTDSGLSPTEEAVRALVEAGVPRDRIATQIGITARGVEDVVQRIRAKLGIGPGERLVGLSVIPKRQREIADLVASGLTDSEIARRLGLSVRTVESHVSRLLRRFGVRARGEVAEALERFDQAGSGKPVVISGE